MAKAKNKCSFEEMLSELEQKITAMESGELTLDQLLQQYADGVKLIRACRAKLEAAEQTLQAGAE